MGEEVEDQKKSEDINKQIKHLEFIQAVVTRLNTNSFQVKGLAVTLVSALLALAASTKEDEILLIALPMVVIFWFLDAYYLRQERLFREVYKEASGRKMKNIKPKYLKTPLAVFDMNVDRYRGKTLTYSSAFWSVTIRNLYLSVFALI